MAVQLQLLTFVTDAGVPVTGLSGANIPEIEIWNAGTGAVIQASTDGTEVAGGWYRFSFTPTAGVDYVGLWDNDPAAAGNTTPQERFMPLSFSEFIDDIVPEGGTEDYGTKFQRLDAAVTTRAAPGAAMDLVANAVDAAAVATDAIDADALAADAVDEIRDSILSDSTPFDGADIDVAVSTRNAVTPMTAALSQTEHDATQADIAALQDLSEADVQSALTAQGYTSGRAPNLDDLDATVSSRATQASVDVIDQNVDDLEQAMISIQLAATAGSSATEIRTGATQASNFFDDMTIVVVNAAGVASRRIQGYANTNGAFTVDALPFTPAVSDPVIVVNRITTDLTDVENTVWDAPRASHSTGGTFGEFTGDATMRGTDGANTVIPMLGTLSQTEHDATQTLIGALANLDATAVENAVWDAVRASHVGASSYGLNTGDAPMRGTDGANTVAPLPSATDQAEHDQTQADIAALTDIDQTGVQAALTAQGYTSGRAPNLDDLDATVSSRAIPGDAMALTGATVLSLVDDVWDELTAAHETAATFGKAITRLFGELIRTKLFFAVSAISTGGREVPSGAISHMEMQVRDDGGAFPGASYFVVFGYNAGDSVTDPPRSSNTAAVAPTDGTFTSTAFPT